MEKITVTAENIDAVKETMAAWDQAADLIPGCVTWGIIYQPGNQRGQMTTWPNGRMAISCGGDSVWGDCESDGTFFLDEDPGVIDDTGERI